MRPRWRKVLTDLTGNLVRSLLVVVSIAVGLVAVGMIVILFHTIGDDMREGYAAIHPANIQIRTNAVDDDYIVHLNRVAGVKKAEGMRIFDLRVRSSSGQFKAIKIKAYDYAEGTDLNLVRIQTGMWPPSENEIVLGANRLSEVSYQVGDLVEIKLASGEVRSLRLVGIVLDQTIGSDGGGAGFFLAPIQGYISRETLTFLDQPDEINSVHFSVVSGNDDLAHIDEVADRLAKDFEHSGFPTSSIVIRRSIDHPNAPYIDAMKAVLYLMGFLVVFLSGFLIINTLSALLNQQIEQIGVMKTFGATRAAVIGIYLALVFVYSLLGLGIAIPLSNLVANYELEQVAPTLNFLSRGIRLVPQAVITQTIIAFLIPQVAALYPVLHGTGLPIQQALSGISTAEGLKLDRFTVWLSRLRGASRPMAISLRNTFRQRTRLSLTLITLALGGAIFIATFNMRASLESFIARLGRYLIADVMVTFDEPYRIEEVKSALNLLPEINTIEGWAIATGQMVLEDGQPGESILLQAPPANTVLVEPIVIQGRWLLPEDRNALVLNELFLTQFPELKPGDLMTLKIAGNESEWTLVGFFQFAGKNIGLMGYTNYDSLARTTHSFTKAIDYRITSTKSGLTLAEQSALARQVETFLTQQNYKVKEARAGQDLRTRTTQGLDTLTNFLLFLSMLMAAVGSIGLTGTMSLNVLERTREIGVMRAIGASDREVFRIVLVEGLLIGLISWAISIAAAFPVSKGLSEALGGSIFGSPLPFQYVITGPVIWSGIILLFSFIASILPARSAVRMTIREILAYE